MYPAYEYEESVLTGEVAGEHFYARGTRSLHMGWKAVYENQSEDEEEEELKRQNLPVMQKGQEFSISNIRLTEGKTKPPARFTEGTLIAAMENPVRYMESGNKEMAKTLGETGGLGTVATRADIIEKLFSSFFIREKRGRDLYHSEGKAAFGTGSGRSAETGADSGMGDETFQNCRGKTFRPEIYE